MNLVVGHDATIAKWAEGKFGRPMGPWFRAVGIIDGAGLLQGAAVLFDWNGSNLELAYVGAGSLKPSVVRALARFCFGDLKATRVTARTRRNRRATLRALPKFGFRFEGVSRRYYGPGKKDDALNFGLVRADAARLLRE